MFFFPPTKDVLCLLERTWLEKRGYITEKSLRTTVLKHFSLYLQSNLREALLSRSVEYRRSYLTALVAVMAGGNSTLPRHLPQWAPLEEPVLPECLDLLLRDLEEQRGGPEFLSQALFAASLLLSQCSDSRFLHVLLSLFQYTVTYCAGTLQPAALTSFFLSLCKSVQTCSNAGAASWSAIGLQTPLKCSGWRVLKLCVWLEFL